MVTKTLTIDFAKLHSYLNTTSTKNLPLYNYNSSNGYKPLTGETRLRRHEMPASTCILARRKDSPLTGNVLCRDIKASGIIQKLDYICLIEVESKQFREAERTSEVLRNWTSILRKDNLPIITHANDAVLLCGTFLTPK